jgi:3-hydroxymyristoyl/3-hydroxydecanoyl-(acyl carrier protein) dehydratase
VTTLTTLETPALLDLLPHRPPILMVDVLDVAADRSSAVGHKMIRSDELCFHDTEQTGSQAYPHGLVVESLGQAAAALWLVRAREQRAGGAAVSVLYFAKAQGVRFLSDAYPGDDLVHEVWFEREVGGTAIMSGRTSVDGRPIAVVDSIIAASR